MNTQEFHDALSGHDDKALVFQYDPTQSVPPGYHLTEVINASFNSMDCGGVANTWQQTIIQLMGPSISDKREYMTVAKFKSIYQRAAGAVSPNPQAELRIEYGNSERGAMHHHVSHLETRQDHIVVVLQEPGVTCKAGDRRISEAACCLPESAQSTIGKVVWGESAPKQSPKKSGCC